MAEAEEEEIDCDELVRQADELEAALASAQTEIKFGPLVCSVLSAKLKSVGGRPKFYDNKDKKKSDSSHHVVVEVCAQHVQSAPKEKSRYSKHMRLANQAFGISLSDKLSFPLSGVIFSSANATGTVLKSLYCSANVEGLTAGTNRVVAVDGSLTSMTTLNPNVTGSIAANTMTLSFHDDDTSEEEDMVTYRLNDDVEAEWGRKQLVGTCTLERSGCPIKMAGLKFYCNLSMHNHAQGPKVFSLSLWRDLIGNAYLKLTTSIGEVETRTFSMHGAFADDHITFGVEGGGQAEDTYAELIAAQDEDAEPLSRKRGGAHGVDKATSKKGRFERRFESRSHKEWGATLDLSELVRAIEPIKDTIAALWLHPFTSCLVFHALLIDGDVLALSIANAVEDD